MKSVLILCSAFAVAYAGVGTLSAQEEQQALDLFQRACSGGGERSGGYGGGSSSDGAVNIGDFTVYCKKSRDDLQETLSHQVNIPGAGPGQGQVVFVQPPPVRYQHNIQLTGAAGQAQQSKIYVLPQRATHQISTQYNPGTTNTVKPVVYFLKDGGSSAGQPGQQTPPQYGAPAPIPVQPQPQQPGQGYQYTAPNTAFTGYN